MNSDNEEIEITEFLKNNSCPSCMCYTLDFDGGPYYTAPLRWPYKCKTCGNMGTVGYRGIPIIDGIDPDAFKAAWALSESKGERFNMREYIHTHGTERKREITFGG